MSGGIIALRASVTWRYGGAANTACSPSSALPALAGAAEAVDCEQEGGRAAQALFGRDRASEVAGPMVLADGLEY